MSELLNLVGLSAGVVLYAMLLAMVVRAGRRTTGAPRVDPLLLTTAVLGLIWNLCALPAYELPKIGIGGPFFLLVAQGDPQLSLVVLDTGAGATPEALASGRASGVGLRNVDRRLVCQYGSATSLTVTTALGLGTTVEIRLPVERVSVGEAAERVAQ